MEPNPEATMRIWEAWAKRDGLYDLAGDREKDPRAFALAYLLRLRRRFIRSPLYKRNDPFWQRTLDWCRQPSEVLRRARRLNAVGK